MSNGFGASRHHHGGGIVLPTKSYDGLIGLSVKMAGVTLNDCIIDSGSRRLATNSTNAVKANLSSYPKSVILGETTTAYNPKPSLQPIEKYHVPLEVAGVGIFPAVAVNVKSTPTDTLIPAGDRKSVV